MFSFFFLQTKYFLCDKTILSLFEFKNYLFNNLETKIILFEIKMCYCFNIVKIYHKKYLDIA